MWNSENMKVDTLHFKCLIIGTAGSGKTYFAGSFPSPAFVFDFDQAAAGYRDSPGFSGETYKPVAGDWIKFESTARKVLDDPSIKTLIIDSATTMRECAMERAMGINPQRSPTGGPIGIAVQSHYSLAKNLMSNMFNRLLAADKNLVVIAHLVMEKDELTNLVTAIPVFIGQSKASMPTLFTEVYYATVQKVKGKREYLLTTANNGIYAAKSVLSGRKNRLPEQVPNNYAAIMSYLKE